MTDAGSGRQYYVNRSTGATQWHAPDGVDFAAADQVLAEMAEQPMRNALDREGGNVESQEVKTADGAGGGGREAPGDAERRTSHGSGSAQESSRRVRLGTEVNHQSVLGWKRALRVHSGHSGATAAMYTTRGVEPAHKGRVNGGCACGWRFFWHPSP